MIAHRRLTAGLAAPVLSAFLLFGACAALAQEDSQPQPVYPDQPQPPPAQPQAESSPDTATPAPSAQTLPPPEPEGKTQPYAPSAIPSGPQSRSAETKAGEKSDLQSLGDDPKQWPTAAKNYASTRYSELDEINARMSASCRWRGNSRSAPTRARRLRR